MNNTNTTNTGITMYTVSDVQNIFKCSRNQAYNIVNTNGFPSMKLGKKILVEKSSLEKWIGKNAGKSILL